VATRQQQTKQQNQSAAQRATTRSEQPQLPEVYDSLLTKSLPTFQKMVQRLRGRGERLVAEQEIGFARNLIRKAELLRECTHESLSAAFTEVASIGLSLNPVFQYATIIPIWNDRIKRYEAALWPMYRGLIKLASDYGLVTVVKVENVFKADTFVLSSDEIGDHFKHIVNVTTPRNTDDNPYLGTYVAAHRAGKPTVVTWIPAEDIEKMKLQSKNYAPDKPNCVWIKWEDEMRKKSAIKRAQKYWVPESGNVPEQLQRAVYHDNVIDGTIIPESSSTEVVSASSSAIETEKTITDEEYKGLLETCRKYKIRPAKICELYKIESLSQLPADLLSEVRTRLETAVQEYKKAHPEDPKPTETTREPGSDDDQGE
jgi:recombination protein RecT